MLLTNIVSDMISSLHLLDMYEFYNAHGEKEGNNGKAKEGKKRGRPPKTDLEKMPVKSDAPKKSEKKPKKEKEAKPPKEKKSKGDNGGAPPAKKAKTTDPVTARVNSSNPKSFIRQRVAKDFDGENFYGTVMEYDDSDEPAFWHVQYDDGDEEDYSKKDLIQALKLYEQVGKSDPYAKGRGP